MSKRLSRTQRAMLEQLSWGTKMSQYISRSQSRTASVLERDGLIVVTQPMGGMLVLGRYRLTSRGWAALGKAPCKGAA